MQRLVAANRIAPLRFGRVQADEGRKRVLEVLLEKRREMGELVSSRMCLASERVDELEVEIAVLGEVEERGIDERVIPLVASARQSCKDRHAAES